MSRGMIAIWESVDKTQWTHQREEKELSFLAFRLRSLPDFSAPRFDYLAKDVDERSVAVARKQMQMIRQLHSLGDQWGISLRFVKNTSIELYVIFRNAVDFSYTSLAAQAEKQRIQNALMNQEYTFEEVPESENALWQGTSWINEFTEITKSEQIYTGDKYPTNAPPQEFYIPFLWTPTDNTMEHICQALMNHDGKAVIDVTLQPTKYLTEERDWMSLNITRLRECMNGETIRSRDGRTVLWQGNKLPMLKTPLDNCEKQNKQYDMGHVFLSSICAYAEKQSYALADAFIANSVKGKGELRTYTKGYVLFDRFMDYYRNVTVPADMHTSFWYTRDTLKPMRAQRLSRLVSLEEISNFFRIPIPIKTGFPGFVLDTGLGVSGTPSEVKHPMNLGYYLDEAGSQKQPATFECQQFAKHGLIVGVPGSGKTTAMFNILYQLWAVPDEQKIPFIILEPAKTEYRALKTLPEFRRDMLVFTLGDESTSPFRFNPMEVLPGIRLENHISRLQACFVGAFNLFDPLPIFLEQAIRRTYLEKGWYEDSRGGEPGLETPTLSDLCRNAEYVVSNSGFDTKMRSDFQASLLERLNSLRRGSKGRMLDTRYSIPMEDLMGKPVVLELDSLNADEKSLLMMFLLSYVYEYCKVKRKSGSPLSHLLLVECQTAN